jgi:anti-sigma-K factor RskA
VPGLPAVDDGYYEVWMASSDAATMVAIGTLNPGEEAVLRLPAGMQMADFPLVDVSVAHFDGDAGHSAVSVVRGLLPA